VVCGGCVKPLIYHSFCFFLNCSIYESADPGVGFIRFEAYVNVWQYRSALTRGAVIIRIRGVVFLVKGTALKIRDLKSGFL